MNSQAKNTGVLAATSRGRSRHGALPETRVRLVVKPSGVPGAETISRTLSLVTMMIRVPPLTRT